jgi:histidine triad (HIT) family protein
VTSDEKRYIVLSLFVFNLSLVTCHCLMDCLFCQIIAGEIPADVIYQDSRSIAFRDIKPQAPLHVLVIPHEHLESLDEAAQKDEALLGHLLRVAARVANEQGLSESGYRTVINTGAGAGQSVFHLHLHVLGGRSLNWPPG